MSRLKITWNVDFDASHACFSEIKEKIRELGKKDVGTLLDIGGATGWYTTRLKKDSPKTRMVVMDMNFGMQLNPDLEYVRGNMLSLPFKNGSFDAVTAMASLHHVHDRIGDVLDDINRVLSRGGTFLTAEPCARNAFVNFAKCIFVTDKHDEYEKAFDPDEFSCAVSDRFRIVEKSHYFYFSYLLPHIVARMPGILKRMGVNITKTVYRIDSAMLKNMPGIRNRSAYVLIMAVKELTAQVQPDDSK